MTAPASLRPSLLAGLVRELRPKQWSKNVLVFAAPIAAGLLDNRDTVLQTLGAFGCFCAAASATYLLNDTLDIDSDRRHPVKKNRPIAAGVVPIGLAYIVAVALLAIAIGGSFLIRQDFGFTILAYLALTTMYSLRLKRLPIIDIVAVAAGFVLRAIGGATATGLPISEWFFIVTSFGALFMVTGKRAGERAELGEDAALIRPSLAAYTPQYLNYLKAVFSAGTMITYCFWAFASAQEFSDGSVLFQLSIVPFAIAILRYALLLDQGKGAEPEQLIFSDRTLLASGALWVLIYVGAIYAS
ncbi:MAG: decaprenyl-phosphate phosphoribosyltransferase [Acidimicrobiales bacterium]